MLGTGLPGNRGPASRLIPGGDWGIYIQRRARQEEQKHLIYSLPLTFLQVLIMKIQSTAPPHCHNRKLIEYLYKPRKNHCLEEKQNLKPPAGPWGCLADSVFSRTLYLSWKSFLRGVIRWPQNTSSSWRERLGAWGTAQPLLGAGSRFLSHCIGVTRWPPENHGSPGHRAILPEPGHVKATEKAGAL